MITTNRLAVVVLRKLIQLQSATE